MDGDWSNFHLRPISTSASQSDRSRGGPSGSRTSRPHTRVTRYSDLISSGHPHDGSQTSRPFPLDTPSYSTNAAGSSGQSSYGNPAMHQEVPWYDTTPAMFGQGSDQPLPHSHDISPQWYGDPSSMYSQPTVQQQQQQYDYSSVDPYASVADMYPFHQNVNMLPLYDGAHLGQVLQPAHLTDIEQASTYAASPLLPPSSHGVITRLGPYIRPFQEYTLIVKPTIDGAQSPDELVYDMLDLDQRQVILEHIRAIRPSSAKTISVAMRRKLRARIAEDILSGDVRRIEAGVELVTKEDRPVGGKYAGWMIGLTHEQRRQVVEEFAEATEQATDLVREKFLERRLSPVMAIDLLNLTTDEQRVEFARRHNLIFDVWSGKGKWQKGLSTYQKESLMQRMTATHISETWCKDLLLKSGIPTGFGKTLLRADNATFEEYMKTMRNVKQIYYVSSLEEGWSYRRGARGQM
ncbi:hypothetical protein CBS101457_000120 [Exobasidium rhododendri]|nr:hypothetical protein CBS101457_000120 [Exobasidium rhododendri]